MKIVMITRLYSPHVGGVEKHTEKLTNLLLDKKISVTIITEKYKPALHKNQKHKNFELIRIDYPKTKFIGILVIWFKLLINIRYFLEADLIHIHDVFIWYLPIRIILFFKPVYTTFHGWEGQYPLSKTTIFQKQIASKLSTGTIAIGDYIGKYYKIIPTLVLYGGVKSDQSSKVSKLRNNIIFLGRLDSDTGLKNFLKFLDNYPLFLKRTIFIGEGKFKHICQEYGEVIGTTNPEPFLKNAKIVVTSGYLSILESFINKAKVYVYADNSLKEDYYSLSPFSKYLNYLNKNTTKKEFDIVSKKSIDGAYSLSKKYTWKSVLDSYLRLWNIS